jgi:hypothetical protein
MLSIIGTYYFDTPYCLFPTSLAGTDIPMPDALPRMFPGEGLLYVLKLAFSILGDILEIYGTK